MNGKRTSRIVQGLVIYLCRIWLLMKIIDRIPDNDQGFTSWLKVFIFKVVKSVSDDTVLRYCISAKV